VSIPPNITTSLSKIASATPDAIALLDSEASISYGELDQAVSWAARYFANEGLARDTIVALDLPDQYQHLISSLALARLGVAQIAFGVADPPLLRQNFARRLRIAAIICDKDMRADAPAAVIEPPPRDVCEIKALKSVRFDGPDNAATPLLILRTSGTSTGVPKLGVLTHASAQPRIEAKGFALPAGLGCRYLALGDLSFNSVKTRALHCVLSGGCLVLHRNRLDPQSIVDLIAARGVNYVSCSPSRASSLLDLADESEILLPGVEAFRVGSTFVPQPLREQILNRLTPNLLIAYGITEIGTVSIASPEIVRNMPGVVGTIVPGISAEVIDETGMVLPPETTGRLKIKGPGMIQSYLDAPEDSQRAFREGWFYSDDRVEFTRRGELIHHGRVDDVMIFDGININPVEIENVILRHPALSEAEAFAIPDDVHGDVPFAAVVLRSKVSETELLSYCRSRLGAHSPQAVFIVPSLPRNAAGKVIKSKLRQVCENRAL
jgi:cyanophycin synthetase